MQICFFFFDCVVSKSGYKRVLHGVFYMISICAVLHWGKHNQFAFERKAVYLLLGNLSLPQKGKQH